MIIKPLTSLLFALLTFAAVGYAQNSNDKLQIGLNISPDICYRHIFATEGNENIFTTTLINLRNSSEKPKLGYSGGLCVVYRYNPKLSFQAGFNYANLGFKSEIAGFIGPVEEDFPLSAKYIDNFQYLEVPAKVNFIFGENRLQYTIGAGLSSAYLMETKHTVVSYYADSTTREHNQNQDPYKPFNLFATLNVGLLYQLSNKWQLKLEPTFRYGLLKTSDTPVSGRLYNFGLSSGIYLTL
jgi:hypothetical protein